MTISRAGYLVTAAGCWIGVLTSTAHRNVPAALALMFASLMTTAAWEFWKAFRKAYTRAEAQLWEIEDLTACLRDATYAHIPDGCRCAWEWNPDAGWYPWANPDCAHHGQELRDYLESL